MKAGDLPKPKKNNLNEFFFQFLMTFLGVTLGFFSFSLREHLTGKSKEKSYVVEIKNDLAADTTSLNIFIPTLFHRVIEFDSLIYLLETPSKTSHGADLYYYARASTQSRTFQVVNNTITGLKNTGNFGMISNEKVIKALIGFQKNIDLYLSLTAIDMREAEMLYPYLGNLFNAAIFDNMFKSRERSLAVSIDTTTLLQPGEFAKPGGNPQLRNHNKNEINLFKFYLHERKSTFIGEITFLQEEKKEAASLIALIGKEYHL